LLNGLGTYPPKNSSYFLFYRTGELQENNCITKIMKITDRIKCNDFVGWKFWLY